MEVAHVAISENCNQHYPCKHFATVGYVDGSLITQVLDGVTLANDKYWRLMAERDRKHFAEYRPRRTWVAR